MIQFLAGPIAKLAGDLIDNLFETEEEKADAKAKLMKLEQQGKLEELQVSMSAILEEARSRILDLTRAPDLSVCHVSGHHPVLYRRRDRYLVAERGDDCRRQYPRSARRHSRKPVVALRGRLSRLHRGALVRQVGAEVREFCGG